MTWRLIHYGAAVGLTMSAITGCQPYRIEYRVVPEYFAEASPGGRLPGPATLPDGTVIVYKTRDFGGGAMLAESEQRIFEPIVEHEDGSVELHALLPEHVLGNLMYCLREEKYESCWDQVLSETTRQAMAGQGEGKAEFIDFLQRNRRELMVTFNRMAMGMPRQDMILESPHQGVTRMKFRPQIASEFRFRRVDMISEGLELKLLVIR
jgi:hypothetical protein